MKGEKLICCEVCSEDPCPVRDRTRCNMWRECREDPADWKVQRDLWQETMEECDYEAHLKRAVNRSM
jgi:hypothetical protein